MNNTLKKNILNFELLGKNDKVCRFNVLLSTKLSSGTFLFLAFL